MYSYEDQGKINYFVLMWNHTTDSVVGSATKQNLIASDVLEDVASVPDIEHCLRCSSLTTALEKCTPQQPPSPARHSQQIGFRMLSITIYTTLSSSQLVAYLDSMLKSRICIHIQRIRPICKVRFKQSL